MLKCLNYFGCFFLFLFVVLKALCKSLQHSFALLFFLFFNFGLYLLIFLMVFFFLIFNFFSILWDEPLLLWDFGFGFYWCWRSWFLFHLNFFNNLCCCFLCKFLWWFIFLLNWFWFWLFNFFWFLFLLHRFG